MPMSITDLPHLLAAINLAIIISLIFGHHYIRQGRRDRHRAAMSAALFFGVAFLVVYLYYHSQSGLARFGGTGFIRPVYFSLLMFHIALSAAAAVLVPLLAWRAIRGQFTRHRKLARFVWPLWMTVAITGLMVYVMSVHLYPWSGDV